jgi:HKD family nuclease
MKLSEKEVLVNQIENSINACKNALKDTDYYSFKYNEGALSDAEFKETKELRASWRQQINDLEAELAALDEQEIEDDTDEKWQPIDL